MAKAETTIYRVETDGFYGELFRPEEDKYPGKALISVIAWICTLF